MNERLILVVDDSQFLCAMLKKALDSVGYNTLVAYTMEEGMRLFEQSRPDLVLLDINLPDTPGPKACRQIKNNPQYSGVSIILMSGSYEEYIRQQVTECDADGYIKKPFSPSSILRWVKENSHNLFSRPDQEDTFDAAIQYEIGRPPATEPTRTRMSTSSSRTVDSLSETSPRKEPFSGQGRTIVITDDSTFLCAILKDTLEKVGFSVHTFPNIRETGYFLKNNDADLLFLDVNLPDIAGDRACSIIKDSPRTGRLPIVLISSAEEKELERLTIDCGADGYLIKPFTPLNILEWIKSNAESLFRPRGVCQPPDDDGTGAPCKHRGSYAEPATDASPRPDSAPPPSQPAAADYPGPTQSEIDILMKQLHSEMKEVRLDACYTLGEFRIPAAVEPLISMLDDGDDEIRGEAAWALGEIGDPKALGKILSLIETDNKWLRDRAVEALGKFGDHRAVPPLIAILRDSDDREMKVTAVKALAGIPCEASRQALGSLVGDSDEEVAANAMWALKKLEDGREG